MFFSQILRALFSLVWLCDVTCVGRVILKCFQSAFRALFSFVGDAPFQIFAASFSFGDALLYVPLFIRRVTSNNREISGKKNVKSGN